MVIGTAASFRILVGIVFEFPFFGSIWFVLQFMQIDRRESVDARNSKEGVAEEFHRQCNPIMINVKGHPKRNWLFEVDPFNEFVFNLISSLRAKS